MRISYLWAKLLKKIRGAAIIHSNIHPTSKVVAGSHIVNSTFDKYSYCAYDCEIINTSVGAFTSIASNVTIGCVNHPADWASMSPVFYAGRDSIRKKFATYPRTVDKRTTIGNDVWIGQYAIIKQGVVIGNGAIIGMGSVVTKDVPPYAIVAGNPAKLIRMRFTPEIVQALNDSQWWNLNDSDLEKVAQYIKEPKEFIKHISEL